MQLTDAKFGLGHTLPLHLENQLAESLML